MLFQTCAPAPFPPLPPVLTLCALLLLLSSRLWLTHDFFVFPRPQHCLTYSLDVLVPYTYLLLHPFSSSPPFPPLPSLFLLLLAFPALLSSSSPPLSSACLPLPFLLLISPPNVQTGEGDTPLILAAWNGRTDVVRFLLSVGADPNLIKATTGVTPLMMVRARSCLCA